jgi:serine/threonine-protein kinase
MAEVWQARHLALDARVAIKLLLGATAADVAARRRFSAEAQITARLRSRYAVQVFDFGVTEDGQPFLVMELLDGETLGARLRARGRLSPRPAAALLGQAARALDKAHALGIVHRDLKPENLFVVPDDDGGEQIKVMDFGVAKLLGGLAEEAAAQALAETEEGEDAKDAQPAFGTLTRTGTRVGTPYYMAPEQIAGDTSAGRAVDVWAFGVVAFECLTGRHPFDGADVRALFQQIREGVHPPARALNTELPEAFDAWFDRACARDPRARFASAADAVVELRVALGLPAITAAVRDDDDVVVSSAGGGGARRAIELSTTVSADGVPVDANSGTRAATTRVRRRLVVPAALAAALAVAAVGAWAARGRLGLGASAGASAGAGAGASAGAGAGADTPISANPAAAAAFAAGMQAWADGSSNAAVISMQHASDLDPGLGAAVLRVALWGDIGRFWMMGSLVPRDSRAFYAQARAQRAAASEYERAFIDAFEPRYGPKPDPAETEKRLLALSASYPSRGEPLYWVAMLRAERADRAAEVEAEDRALAAEPSLRPAVLALRAWRPASSDEAAAILDQCVAASPSASDCLGERTRLHGMAGSCAAMLADAHAWVLSDDKSAYAYHAVAEGLLATDAPIDGVREAYEADLRLREGVDADQVRSHGAVQLDEAAGDFDAAIADSVAHERAIESSSILSYRFAAAVSTITVAFEAGDRATARASATAFVARVPAWTPESAVEASMVLPVLALARESGGLSDAEYQKQRAAWLSKVESMAAGAPSTVRRVAWLYAYGSARTPGEAKEALAALERYPSMDALDVVSPFNAGVLGRVRLLAGDAAGAVPYLRRASTTCQMLNSFYAVLHARYDLANALVASGGDRDEARALYRGVVALWGQAKPRSLTAEGARAKLRALGD